MAYESVIRMNSYEGFAMPTIFQRSTQDSSHAYALGTNERRQERDIAENKSSKGRLKYCDLQFRMTYLKQSLKQARRETKKSNSLASAN